jgi:glycosyltransferase involved in cell wall biosynthesis
MPVRDGGEYLEAAVASILNQAASSLELILVDDHSRDGAVARLPADDPGLVLMENEGNGVSSAFNNGLSRARGSFIARMDADDIALPGRIDTQLAYLQAHPDIDICGACVEIFRDGGVEGGNLRYQEWLNGCRTAEAIHREMFIESPVPNPTAMFRREAIERLRGYGDPDWPEDYDLFLRADAMGLRMGKPAGILLRWREHPGRLTRSDGRYALERFQAAKAHFLSRHRLRGRSPVILWGAGPSGRRMHDLLLREGTAVRGFLDVHPRRIGGEKRGLPVWPIEKAGEMREAFILVAVGAAGARAEIRDYLERLDFREGENFLFVA